MKIFALVVCVSARQVCLDTQMATCEFQGAAQGTVTITEQQCSGQTRVQFTGQLDCSGCYNDVMGFHVHGSGQITDENGNLNCKATGGHFKVGNQIHGLPSETNADGFHFGALGNVEKTDDNKIIVDVTSERISLTGELNGIGGRGMVLHADNDKGVNFQSSGNAGPRLACCTITEPVPLI